MTASGAAISRRTRSDCYIWKEKTMQNLNEGLLFDPALSAEIKDRFY